MWIKAPGASSRCHAWPGPMDRRPPAPGRGVMGLLGCCFVLVPCNINKMVVYMRGHCGLVSIPPNKLFIDITTHTLPHSVRMRYPVSISSRFGTVGEPSCHHLVSTQTMGEQNPRKLRLHFSCFGLNLYRILWAFFRDAFSSNIALSSLSRCSTDPL